jgi:DNA-binding IclR family transcriptional regulator
MRSSDRMAQKTGGEIISDETSEAGEGNGGDQAGVQSIETGMALLSALAALTYSGPPPMLKTLAAAAGLAPAKAHRYLVSFLRTELVERDAASGRYRLGPLARHIGIASIRSLDVVRVATAELPQIGIDLKHSVALAIWAVRGATVVWVEDYPRPITINTRVGEVLPILTSATGRVFGAWLPAAQTAELAERELEQLREFPRPNAPIRMEDAERLFAETRAAGVGWTAGGLNPTINALSAPVFDFRGGLVAAISALGPADIFDASPDGELASKLKAAAARVSATLGYRAEG